MYVKNASKNIKHKNICKKFQLLYFKRLKSQKI
ncbi:hypothetical protein [Staphylococcus aureus]|nr:hypothetical protein [Staphylococcus aureus]MCW8314408.1 hypothetical protein [Staphylococcus aureus]